jgi:hypothetical protein
MRHLQVYILAGSLLPRTPILEMIDTYIRDLHGCRRDWVRRSN